MTLKPIRQMPMEQCSWCGGHGVRYAGADGVEDCTECGGGGVVEKRAPNGRFLPWEIIGWYDPDEDRYLNDPQRGGSLPEDDF